MKDIKLRQDEFIIKSNIIHNNFYNYSLVEYINSISQVKIICPKHNYIFSVKPSKHISSKLGCPKCSLDKRKLNYNTETFIKKIISIVGDNIFDFSKTIYTKSNKKITLICKKCNLEFNKTPNFLLKKTSFPKCSRCDGREKLTKETFIERAIKVHNNIYSYSEINFIYYNTKIKISCNKCNKLFFQNPSNHLQGAGCHFCSPSKKLTTQDFIDRSIKIHGKDSFDYSKVIYINSKTKVILICKKCNYTFNQEAFSHFIAGCPRCPTKYSKIENEWLDYLKIPKEYRAIRLKIDGHKYCFDAYDKITNTIYEFYGDYWHGNPQIYDQNKKHGHKNLTFGELYNKTIEKEKNIIKAGYNLIIMWENDWNIFKKSNKHLFETNEVKNGKTTTI